MNLFTFFENSLACNVAHLPPLPNNFRAHYMWSRSRCTSQRHFIAIPQPTVATDEMRFQKEQGLSETKNRTPF